MERFENISPPLQIRCERSCAMPPLSVRTAESESRNFAVRLSFSSGIGTDPEIRVLEMEKKRERSKQSVEEQGIVGGTDGRSVGGS